MSSVTASATYTSGSSGSLDAQLAKLEKQIQSVTDDKTLDEKTRAAELQTLEMQKAQLEAQIAKQKQAPSEAAPTAKQQGFYAIG